MTVTYTRSRAFRRWASILQLPGTEALRLVDTGVVAPVVDLARMMQSSLVTEWIFIFEATEALASTPSDPLDFYQAPNWTKVFRNGRSAATVEVIPDDEEAWVIDMGLMLDTAAAIDNAFILRSGSDAAVTLDFLRPLWHADASVGGMGIDALAVNSKSASPYLVQPPWWVSKKGGGRLRFNADFNAALTYQISLSVISAPDGVLPAGMAT